VRVVRRDVSRPHERAHPGSYSHAGAAPEYEWTRSDESRAAFVRTIEEGWGGTLGLAERAPTLLSAVRVPTLIVHRVGDTAMQVDEARYIAAEIPDAKLVLLPGDDHLPWVGETEPLLDALHEFLIGSPLAREIDRVFATVLFTDIVGSSEKAAALRDGAWRELLARHHELCGGSSPTSAALRSTAQATASSLPSTGRRARSSAPARSSSRRRSSGSRSAPACTRENASC
jgi:hypothetical protein